MPSGRGVESLKIRLEEALALADAHCLWATSAHIATSLDLLAKAGGKADVFRASARRIGTALH